MSKYHLFLDTPTKENVDIPDVGNNYEEDKGCFQRDLFAAKKEKHLELHKTRIFAFGVVVNTFHQELLLSEDHRSFQ